MKQRKDRISGCDDKVEYLDEINRQYEKIGKVKDRLRNQTSSYLQIIGIDARRIILGQ